MARNITVVQVVTSEFDSDANVFRRSVIGADGFGYHFVRPVSVDRQNLVMETAIAHDIREWLQSASPEDLSVVAFAPKYDPMREVIWQKEIHVARPTRHYWHPQRLQVHSRIKTRQNETYNLFTPLCLARQLITALENNEVEVRSRAYDQNGDGVIEDRDDWLKGAFPR